MRTAPSPSTPRASPRRAAAVAAAATAAAAIATVASQLWPVPAVRRPNVLLVLADDLGVEKLSLYGIGANPPSTPSLDALAAQGVIFDAAYAQPVCSPTRANLLTGRYAARHGLGNAIGDRAPRGLSPREVLLPRVLDRQGYSHATVGKWHLSGLRGGLDAPLEAGFGVFRGHLGPARPSYTRWRKIEDGQLIERHSYVTTEAVDDTLALIETLPEPWFVFLQLNAPHAPYHDPPPGLVSSEPRPGVRRAVARYDAMIEAMDTELGRLFDAIDVRRTTVLFMADNGTPKDVTVAPWAPERGKTTLYEGGVHVPLIVAGHGVTQPGRRSDALVNDTDLFATIVGLAGLDPDTLGLELDAHSLAPLLADPGAEPPRAWAYAEKFRPTRAEGPWHTYSRMIRDRRYKLIEHVGIGRELYDLMDRTFEGPDLLATGMPLSPEAQRAHDRLVALLESEFGAPRIEPRP